MLTAIWSRCESRLQIASHSSSYAMNSLKYPPSAKPDVPSEQSQEAYKYLLDFDRSNTPAINLLEELLGVGNVVINKAGPPAPVE
ncbi:hypothetical protein ACHAO7_004853 [Fusarium culmorum]